MIGIYKIQNKINNKIYIGQSVHIERRFQEHCFPSKTSVISKAIQKYGKDNFIFDIVEECNIGELNEKEWYWIKYYNCLVPNGYNVTEDTETIHTNYRYKNKDEILLIINDLLYSSLSMQEIANKYNINKSNISRINRGETHKQINLTYPLRKINNINTNNYCIDCGKEISLTSIRCNTCEGLHRKIPLKDMPITREELKKMIRDIPFTEIGKRFSVTDNSIRKWCDKFNLPRTKKEINSYDNTEWELI